MPFSLFYFGRIALGVLAGNSQTIIIHTLNKKMIKGGVGGGVGESKEQEGKTLIK